MAHECLRALEDEGGIAFIGPISAILNVVNQTEVGIVPCLSIG